METDVIIEAILFYKGEPLSVRELSRMVGCREEEVEGALNTLDTKLIGRGLSLVRAGENVELRTSPTAAATLEKLRVEELSKDLGKAGAETLAIVLYHGPVARSTVDYIRGVNSTFTLRSLLVRGLVERVPNEKDQRSFLYRPTVDLLGHLGVTRVEDLPDYSAVKAELLARGEPTEAEPEPTS